MRIIFSGRYQIHINNEIMSAWFPQQAHSRKIDGSGLVYNLQSRIQNRYGITNHQITKTLYGFFNELERYTGLDEEQTQMCVLQALLTQLRTGAKSHWLADGLRDSRHTFIILAYLASAHESDLLAETLARFGVEGMRWIQKDSPKYLRDWRKAAEKIREVMEGTTSMDMEPFAIMPYAGFLRGRSRRALPWPGHRARSLPAIRRRHSPDMSLTIPTYPSSGWASPIISPVGYPGGDYFDELQNLQWQQSAMGMKLDSVDGKLDVLLGGYGHGYY